METVVMKGPDYTHMSLESQLTRQGHRGSPKVHQEAEGTGESMGENAYYSDFCGKRQN